MNEIKQVSSLQNPLVKKILVLKDKSRERKKTGKLIIEGLRELKLAIAAGYEIETICYYPEILTREELLEKSGLSKSHPPFIEVTKGVYQKIAYRESTEGVLAIANAMDHSLENLIIDNTNALILIAEAPEKPGNLGALLRTADAAQLDAVLIADPKGDLYNPNVIRSSVGCVFTNTIGIGNSDEIIAFLRQNNINIYCAELGASKPYTSIDFTLPSAIVVGTEATGLSQTWLNAATQNIIIPMEGEIDSLNVSVSAAILIFEAKRQRMA